MLLQTECLLKVVRPSQTEVGLLTEDVIVKDDLVVAGILSVMRGRDGIQVEARNAWVLAIRDQKLKRLEMFQTKAEAPEAAGLRN